VRGERGRCGRGCRREYLSSCRRRYPDTFKIDRPAFTLRFVSPDGGLGGGAAEKNRSARKGERRDAGVNVAGAGINLDSRLVAIVIRRVSSELLESFSGERLESLDDRRRADDSLSLSLSLSLFDLRLLFAYLEPDKKLRLAFSLDGIIFQLFTRLARPFDNEIPDITFLYAFVGFEVTPRVAGNGGGGGGYLKKYRIMCQCVIPFVIILRKNITLSLTRMRKRGTSGAARAANRCRENNRANTNDR